MRLNSILRLMLAIAGLVLCSLLVVSSAKIGLSRLLSTVAMIEPGLEPADRAVRLTPADPEAHYTRGLSLVNAQRLNEAVSEFKTAIQLRPHHYYEWLDLGVTLDRLGDESGAIAALKQSVRVAPFFSQPHWQLGNLLFRQANYSEAFSELRLGAKNNRNLVQSMLELAWAASQHDVPAMEALIQPHAQTDHLELARFLAWQGKGSEAAMHARLMGKPTDPRDRELLHQTISALLTAGEFAPAYQAWSADHSLPDSSNPVGRLLNGNFVDPISLDDPGFGWQLAVVPNITASVNPSGPSEGSRSVVLEFGGDSPSGIQLVHQLILVQPQTRYTLSFMWKTEGLITGGPAVIRVVEAGANQPKALGQSNVLAIGTSNWARYELEFVTDEGASAVVIGLQRIPCSQNPCPAFGKVWLSQFSLVKN
jgi:tetratricopeptide (TPR) repeat protein